MGKVMMRSAYPELTAEEEKELERAEKMPLIYDEDSPEMSGEQLREFHRFDEIMVRIAPNNVEKVKSLGSEYQIVINRLVNMALDDTDMVKKCI